MFATTLLCIVLVTFTTQVLASSRCATAEGRIACRKNPNEPLRSEVKMWDKDGKKAPSWMRWFTSAVDPDDLMGRANPDPDGKFLVHGCSDDVFSPPDPYIKIFHYCNREGGQFTTLESFNLFDDEGVYQVNGGNIIFLDDY